MIFLFLHLFLLIGAILNKVPYRLEFRFGLIVWISSSLIKYFHFSECLEGTFGNECAQNCSCHPINSQSCDKVYHFFVDRFKSDYSFITLFDNQICLKFHAF